MAGNKNILIGYGETLIEPVKLTKGGGPKRYPYSIEEVRQRLSPEIISVAKQIHESPEAAKPRGEGVAKITLHPAFLAKSYFPENILKSHGLRHVGSKSTVIVPHHSLRAKPPEEGEFTSVLFVAGAEKNFKNFNDALKDADAPQTHQLEFSRIETIDLYRPTDKIKWIDSKEDSKNLHLEVSLHAYAQSVYILEGFLAWAKQIGAIAFPEKAIYTPGLIFLPVTISKDKLQILSEFSYIRTVRSIAPLRIHRPVSLRRLEDADEVSLPVGDAVNGDLRVAIFDGGIGNDELDQWVEEFTWVDTESTQPKLLGHGNAVTSTVLFGEIVDGQKALPVPYAKVSHYRVISPQNSRDPDLFDVLKKIDWVLQNHQPHFVNLSLGPCLPIDDDDVHVWTTLLDLRLASGNILATVAVGNDGEKVGDLGRVQPPSDMVNALGIGSADTSGTEWNRASYSCIGPGRSPGLVKPDGVAFGGGDEEPLKIFSAHAGGIVGVQGTSFAAPMVLRSAIGVSTLSASPLSATALKALLIHQVEKRKTHDVLEVGWGRFVTDPEKLIACEDNEAMVIYQGSINPGQPIRARIPFPTIALKGTVTIRATIGFVAKTDPAHPINYTKSGLNVIFRPKGAEKKTISFFNQDHYDTEQELRRDAQKWETCMSRTRNFQKDTLDDPVFDIEYLTRDEGRPISADEVGALPYVLIVTVSVKNTTGIYNNILQRYKTLQPIKLRSEIQIRS